MYIYGIQEYIFISNSVFLIIYPLHFNDVDNKEKEEVTSDANIAASQAGKQ